MQRSTITMLACLAITSTLAAARAEESSVVVAGPTLVGKQEVQPVVTVAEEVPVPLEGEVAVAPPVKLVPVRSIKYDTRPSARRAFACHGKIDMVLAVDNPDDGSDCLYEVPVCLPGCCVEDPRVYCRHGLLGRTVVEYFWPCGYEVEVVFRLRGDLRVKFNAD